MPRILIADDESEICQMIQSYAALDGYETIGVSDGAEAVKPSVFLMEQKQENYAGNRTLI